MTRIWSRGWIFAVLLLVGSGLTASATMLVDLSEARAQAPDREFTLAVGETLTFNARGVDRVTVGLSKVADVKSTAGGRQLLVTGASVGVTTMNIFSSEGQKTLLIRVVGVNPTALAEEVRAVLGERSGVDVRVVKGRVLLEGEVSAQRFKDKIEKLTTLYPNQVLNFTTFRESFVEEAKMVALDIYFIQVATTNRDNLGADWGQFFGANYSFGSGDVPLYYSQQQGGGGGGGGGGGNPGQVQLGSGVGPGNGVLPRAIGLTGGSGLNSYWSLVGNLNLALDFLTEHGLVKTIQHGTLITEAGKEAEYQSGGTLIIPVNGLGATEVFEKKYGLVITVRAVVDVDNRVKLDINAEYSELDFASGVGDTPGLRNTSFRGIVNMQEGQSVLIGGFDGQRDSSTETGWWLLSRIPIVGWLFKTRTYLGESVNNALFVTPNLYEPGGKTHKDLVEGIFDNLLDAGVDPTDLPELSNATAPARKSKSGGGGAESGAGN